MIIELIILYAAVCFVQIPRLIKKKQKRMLLTVLIILIVAFGISVLQIENIDFPNPVKDSQFVVKKLYPFSYD